MHRKKAKAFRREPRRRRSEGRASGCVTDVRESRQPIVRGGRPVTAVRFQSVFCPLEDRGDSVARFWLRYLRIDMPNLRLNIFIRWFGEP